MTDVKRFDLGTDNTHYYGVPVIEECEDGDYVLSADYDALKAERDQLRAELAAIRASEPVGEIALSDDGYKIGLLSSLRHHRIPLGTKIFVTQQPQPPVQVQEAVKHDTKGSRKALGAMNAKLKAKIGRLERKLAALQPSDDVASEPVVYDCPRCSTSMQIDPSAKPQPQPDVQALVEALDWLDDFVARCNGDDRGSCEPVNKLRAALAAYKGQTK